MNYPFVITISNIVSIAMFILMLAVSWYYVMAFFLAVKKQKKVPHSDKKTKFAIIVPARNESRVIRKNIESLLKQTYDKNYYDIWIIIESKDDPTYLICKKMGVNCFIRPEIGNRRTKGFAIQDLYNYFKDNDIKYDAFMIFDADNIVSPRYVEIMNDLRQTGVQLGLGYRNYTNSSTNWITCTSAVFFTYMMTFTANMRSRLFRKSTVCGTGYFLDTKVIDEAGGWIFTGMTEDMQVTAYCYYHDVKCRYYPVVDFYDEQCSTLKALHNQSVRWIYGFLGSKTKALKESDADYHTLSKWKRFLANIEYHVSFIPFVIFMISATLVFVLDFIISAVGAVQAPEYAGTLFGYSMISLAIIYGSSCFIAFVVILVDNKKLKFNFATKIWAVFTFFFFYAELLIAAIDGLIHPKKRGVWKQIEHTGTITNKDI